MEDSAFAKIVRGELPCHKIYEDEFTLAFLDIYPKTTGHAMVIPKVRPAQFVWDLDEEIYVAVARTSRKVALRLREVLPYKYVHQAVVGTDVPYAHVHLVPFNETVELHSPQRTEVEPDHEAFAALASELYFKD